MRYFFIYLVFGLTISTGDAAQCQIKRTTLCAGVNKHLVASAEHYAAAVQNLANTMATIPNVVMPGKIDAKEAQAIVKKIAALVGVCHKKTGNVKELFNELKKLEKVIRHTDSVLQKIATHDNATLIKAREDAIKQSNALLALIIRMNESNAYVVSKAKSICKKADIAKDEELDDDSADEEDESEDDSEDESEDEE